MLRPSPASVRPSFGTARTSTRGSALLRRRQFNLGLGIGNFERLVVRPEVGILINPGEDGHFRHFSIGLTYYAGR